MKLYKNISEFCSSYSIPLNNTTIGYLQFYTEFATNANDIVTVKSYTTDGFTDTQIFPFNIIIQKNTPTTMRILVQGLNSPIINENFRYKFELKTETGAFIYLYSDVFKFDLCDNSDTLIPCVVEGQTGSYNDINEFVGNIVYQRWLIPEEKKYTPVVFLRNVAFNQKTSTIEYKKVNNRPLYATNKKNHFLRSELIPQNYIDVFDEVFSLGKVQIKNKVYNIDTYSIDVVDDKDNCSLYKPNITAYEEVKTRIFCSSECVIISPVDCSTYDNATRNINLDFDLCVENFPLVHNITSQFQGLGYEIGDCNEFTIISLPTNATYTCDEDGYYLRFYYIPTENETIVISFNICGVQTLININVNIVTPEVSVLSAITYSDVAPIGYTITGVFNEPEFELEYTLDGINWVSVGNFEPILNAIFVADGILPTDDTFFYIRVIGLCSELVSNEITHQGEVVIPCIRYFISAQNTSQFIQSVGFEATQCNGEIISVLQSLEPAQTIVIGTYCLKVDTLILENYTNSTEVENCIS